MSAPPILSFPICHPTETVDGTHMVCPSLCVYVCVPEAAHSVLLFVCLWTIACLFACGRKFDLHNHSPSLCDPNAFDCCKAVVHGPHQSASMCVVLDCI